MAKRQHSYTSLVSHLTNNISFPESFNKRVKLNMFNAKCFWERGHDHYDLHVQNRSRVSPYECCVIFSVSFEKRIVWLLKNVIRLFFAVVLCKRDCRSIWGDAQNEKKKNRSLRIRVWKKPIRTTATGVCCDVHYVPAVCSSALYSLTTITVVACGRSPCARIDYW